MQDADRAALKHTAVRLVRVAVAVLFGWAGLLKLFGFPSFIRVFDIVFEDQVVRYLIAIMELIGAVLVLRSRTVAIGALLLLAIAIYGILVHLTFYGDVINPLMGLAALTGALAAYELSR